MAINDVSGLKNAYIDEQSEERIKLRRSLSEWHGPAGGSFADVAANYCIAMGSFTPAGLLIVAETCEVADPVGIVDHFLWLTISRGMISRHTITTKVETLRPNGQRLAHCSKSVTHYLSWLDIEEILGGIPF